MPGKPYLWRGLIIPLVIAVAGVLCIVTRTAWIPGRRGGGSLILHGAPGTVMGLMLIFWALGLLLRHGWMFSQTIAEITEFLGLLAYIAAVACGLYLLWLATTIAIL